jgi:PAS domain S-box-containing protein
MSEKMRVLVVGGGPAPEDLERRIAESGCEIERISGPAGTILERLDSGRPNAVVLDPMVLKGLLREAVSGAGVRPLPEAGGSEFRQIVESIQEGVLVIENDFPVYVNDQACGIYGYPPEELAGRNVMDIVAPEDAEFIGKVFQEARTTGMYPESIDFWIVRKDGERRFIRHRIRTFTKRGGGQTVVVTATDLTDWKLADTHLRESEEKFRNLAEQSPNMIFINQGGRVVYASELCVKLTGYPRDVFYAPDFNFLDLIAPEDRPLVIRNFQAHLRGGEVPVYSYRLIRRDGRIIQALINSARITFRGEPAILGIITDVTALKQAETMLRESEEKFRNLADESPNMIFINRGGRIVYANPLCEEITGYTRGELYAPEFNFLNLLAPEERGAIAENFPKHLQGKDMPPFIRTVVAKNGRRIPVIITTRLIPFENERALLGIITDVSKLKLTETRLRESEQKTGAILQSSPMGIHLYRHETDGSLVFSGANPAADHILGIDHSSLSEKTLEQAFPALSMTEIPNAYLEVCRTGVPFHTEFIHRKNGRILGAYDVHAFMTTPDLLVVMFADITDRITTNRILRDSLREKEILLREIHHRVKNNMQVISSLLRLQSNTVRDKKILTILRESQERVRSMALVYEKIYQSSDLARIDFPDYIQSLAKSLQGVYSGGRPAIKTTFRLKSVSMGIDTAVPCGLIVNELITNAHKHAFPPRWKGEPEIRVGLRPRAGNRVELTVADNGIGIPANADFQSAKSFGLFLVRILAEDQLGGTLCLSRNEGTLFRITFPIPQEEDRLAVSSLSDQDKGPADPRGKDAVIASRKRGPGKRAPRRTAHR